MLGRALPLVLASLLLLGGAVWLLTGQSEAEPDEPTAEATATEERAGDPGTLEAEAAAERRRDADAEALGGDAQREQVTEFPTESGGPTLRVVNAADQQPVPFAEVFVGVGGGGDWRNQDWRRGETEPWASALERLQPRRADAEGRVALPQFRRQLRVAGRSERLFGCAVLRADDREPRLLLVPDQTLRARVLGGDGNPQANVQVALCADMNGTLQRLARARSGEDGIAELRHVQLYETRVPPPPPQAEQQQRDLSMQARMREFVARAQTRPGGAAEVLRIQAEFDNRRLEMEARVAVERARAARDAQRRSAEWQAGNRDAEVAGWPLADFVLLAEVPQARASEGRCSPRALPSEPVELRLLPTSSLIVRLLGPDGAPLRTPCSVAVQRSADPGVPADQARAQRDALAALRADKPLGEHTVELGPLGLGLRLDVQVSFTDDDFNFVQRGVPGPSSATPLELEIRSPGWFTALAGRFVDEQAAAIPGLEAELFVSGAKGRVEGERLRLEPDGRFELPVRLRESTAPYTLEVRATVGERAFGKLLALPVLVNGKRTEVGDIVLRELPILAHGVLRDDVGKPIGNAQVRVQARRAEGWIDESFLARGTDAEGRFELRAEPRALELRLRATADGHAGVEQEIAFGARVELTLARLGGIRFDGWRPQFLPREAVRATLTDLATNQSREVEIRNRDADRFELRVGDLRPGMWRVSLQVRGLPRPLGLAESVLVKPGETVRPATLDGIDLRSRVFQFVATAVDQAGQPMNPDSPLLVQLYDLRGTPQWVAFPWRGNQIEMLLDVPSVRVVGLSSGNAPVRTELQAGSATLRLARTHPVTVRLPGLRALLGAEQSARISLVFADTTGWPEADLQATDQRSGQTRGYQRTALGKSSGAGLGGSDEVSMTLMLNGRYEVVLRIDGPGGRVSKTIATVELVVDGAAPQTVTASYDSNVVRDALAELRARPPRR